MKKQTLIAMAVAGSFACAGAFAGGGYHGAHMSSSNSVEVQTPSSVSESAPWLTNHATLPGAPSSFDTIGFQEGQFSDGPVGTSSSLSGTGGGGYDSSLSPSSSHESMGDMSMSDSGDTFATVDYWRLGEESSGTGMSSSSGGAGSGGFDSKSSSPDISSAYDSGLDYSYSTSWDEPLSFVTTAEGEDATLLSQHYLVYGPLAEFEGQNVIVLELGPASEDIALLDALSRDFYVLTPVYDES